MKAFLLAAGHGSRLHPVTARIPKCLVPIQGQPLLDIWLNQCVQFGIRELLINVHAHAEAVRDYLAGHAYDLDITLVEEPILLGSAGTIRVNRSWVEESESFWIFYADVLSKADLRSLGTFHASHNQIATLGVTEVPDPRRCGIVSIKENGLIETFEEKPLVPVSNLAFSGIILARHAFLDQLPAASPADIGFHVLPRLAGNMRAFIIKDLLMDIGTMENYELAQRQWALASKEDSA